MVHPLVFYKGSSSSRRMFLTLSDQIVQVIISGITQGCIYTMMGLSIAVVFNVTRMFDISQGQYAMLGAMLTCVFRISGLSTPLAVFLALVIPLVVGLFVWRIIFYGPSQKYPTLTLIMITFALAMLIEGIAFLVLGTDTRITPAYLNTSPIRIGKATILPQVPLISATLVLMVVGLALLFGHTLVGKALRACYEQPVAARLVGVNPKRSMYFSFLLAVGLGAIGGIIMVPITAASYNMGLPLVVKGFLAAIVGGISRFQGVIAGGLTLGLIESIAAGFISSSYASIIALTIFVIALLFRPHGLLGIKDDRT